MALDQRYVTKRGGRSGDRWYWQRPGYALVRLPQRAQSRAKEAHRLNTEADAGRLERKPVATTLPKIDPLTTLGGIIDDYKRSEDYDRLKGSTRRYYDRWLDEMRATWGAAAPESIHTADCVDALEEIPKLSDRRKAKTVMVNVFSRALHRRRIPFNPVTGIELPSWPKRSAFFTEDDIAAYFDAADKHPTHARMLRLGFALMLFTAQRVNDALTMNWNQYRNGVLRLRQEKTGAWVEIPAHDQLAEILEAERQRAEGTVIVTHAGRGVAYTLWNPRYVETRRMAGIDHLQARDLRRTAVVKMAEGGAEVPQIAAVTGHNIDYTQQIIDTYLPKTAKLAKAGIRAMGTVKMTRGDSNAPVSNTGAKPQKSALD